MARFKMDEVRLPVAIVKSMLGTELPPKIKADLEIHTILSAVRLYRGGMIYNWEELRGVIKEVVGYDLPEVNSATNAIWEIQDKAKQAEDKKFSLKRIIRKYKKALASVVFFGII